MSAYYDDSTHYLTSAGDVVIRLHILKIRSSEQNNVLEHFRKLAYVENKQDRERTVLRLER